jgi:hypothetical protein
MGQCALILSLPAEPPVLLLDPEHQQAYGGGPRNGRTGWTAPWEVVREMAIV